MRTDSSLAATGRKRAAKEGHEPGSADDSAEEDGEDSAESPDAASGGEEPLDESDASTHPGATGSPPGSASQLPAASPRGRQQNPAGWTAVSYQPHPVLAQVSK